MKLLLRISLIIVFVTSIIAGKTTAQTRDTVLLYAVVYNGDTIPAATLSDVIFYSRLSAAQMTAQAKYNRLRNAVYVTYPYARKAGSILNDINAHLNLINNKPDRKKYIHSRERELKKEFTDPITNLSVYQGKILMKLINRETGNNCYEIIKEYRGGFTARLYQTIAFFFDSNLKQAYNPQQDDAIIEKLVKEVQRMYGFDEIAKRPV